MKNEVVVVLPFIIAEALVDFRDNCNVSSISTSTITASAFAEVIEFVVHETPEWFYDTPDALEVLLYAFKTGNFEAEPKYVDVHVAIEGILDGKTFAHARFDEAFILSPNSGAIVSEKTFLPLILCQETVTSEWYEVEKPVVKQSEGVTDEELKKLADLLGFGF